MQDWKRFFPRNEATWPEGDGVYLVALAGRFEQGPNAMRFATFRRGEWSFEGDSPSTVVEITGVNVIVGAYLVTHYTSLPSLPALPILKAVKQRDRPKWATGPAEYYAIWEETTGPTDNCEFAKLDAQPESSIIQKSGGETE